MASDEFLIPPPSNMTVDHERKPVLWLPDGRALVRQVGFHGETAMAYGGKKSGGSGKTPKSGGGKKCRWIRPSR